MTLVVTLLSVRIAALRLGIACSRIERRPRENDLDGGSANRGMRKREAGKANETFPRC